MKDYVCLVVHCYLYSFERNCCLLTTYIQFRFWFSLREFVNTCSLYQMFLEKRPYFRPTDWVFFGSFHFFLENWMLLCLFKRKLRSIWLRKTFSWNLCYLALLDARKGTGLNFCAKKTSTSVWSKEIAVNFFP